MPICNASDEDVWLKANSRIGLLRPATKLPMTPKVDVTFSDEMITIAGPEIKPDAALKTASDAASSSEQKFGISIFSGELVFRNFKQILCYKLGQKLCSIL